jgi:predicted GIY-YIG superfamily endonuclease
MGLRRFDRKFGVDFLRELPETPAVYLFKDEAGVVLYAGKARNIRRRLSDYRNASRRKAHRKMRELVRTAHSLEVRLQPTEGEALLAENQLIRELRPEYNVDGAFDFLYPAVGTGSDGLQTWLCFTSQPEEFGDLDLRWHGSFRPRWRAREGFDALISLLGRVGHLEPRSRFPDVPRLKGSRFVALRRMPEGLLDEIREFLDGESDALLGRLFETLLEKVGARSEAAEVQQDLDSLAVFHREDVLRLRQARQRVGHHEAFVPRDERDALFIRAKLDVTNVADSQEPSAARPL